MKEYDVHITLGGWETYRVKARNEEEAKEKVMSGKCGNPIKENIEQYGIDGVEEIK